MPTHKSPSPFSFYTFYGMVFFLPTLSSNWLTLKSASHRLCRVPSMAFFTTRVENSNYIQDAHDTRPSITTSSLVPLSLSVSKPLAGRKCVFYLWSLAVSPYVVTVPDKLCLSFPSLSLCAASLPAWSAFDNMQTPFHVSVLRSLPEPAPQADCFHNIPMHLFQGRVSPMSVEFFVVCCWDSVHYELLIFVFPWPTECLPVSESLLNIFWRKKWMSSRKIFFYLSLLINSKSTWTRSQ